MDIIERLLIMMDQIEAGKVIFVSGSPFSGKTYLILNLCSIIPDLHVVNFELYCRDKDGYSKFYNHVRKLQSLGKMVVAESVNNYNEMDHIWSPSRFYNFISIFVKPNKDLYYKNYKEFLDSFGKNATIKRSGNLDINNLYDSGQKPVCSHFTYNGSNLKEIMEICKNYVSAN